MTFPVDPAAPVPPDEEPESWACCGQTFTGTADFISGARAAHVCPPEDVPDAEIAYAMVCYGKRRYKDNIAALLALSSSPERRAYRCPVCRGYHLTRQPARVPTRPQGDKR